MPQQNQIDRQRPVTARPQIPERKKYFRWELLIIPAVILFIIWFINGVEPAGTWEDFLDYIEIDNKPRFSMLACLGLTIVAIVAIARVLRDSKKD